MISKKEILLLYGNNAIGSRKGRFVLVHLDRPTRPLVRARTRNFDPDEFLDNGCPICQSQKAGGIVVFDDTLSEYPDEEIVT
jgi:hypothetical protein